MHSQNLAPDPKPALRRHFRALRRAHVDSLAAADRAAAYRALAAMIVPLTAGATMIASHAALGAEIDPVEIEHLTATIAFPRVSGSMLTLHAAAWRDLVPGYRGIPEPAADAPAVVPDIVLVPLLAVTLAGVRLGQGGGFYDRTLATLRSQRRVIAIGLAWDLQITDALPGDPWDQPLDHIATPTRLVDCAGYR